MRTPLAGLLTLVSLLVLLPLLVIACGGDSADVSAPTTEPAPPAATEPAQPAATEPAAMNQTGEATPEPTQSDGMNQTGEATPEPTQSDGMNQTGEATPEPTQSDGMNQTGEATPEPTQSDGMNQTGEATPEPTSDPGAAAPSDEPFRIGAMDALTGVGESYGNPVLNSKILAVEEINADGGINGRMLELIAEDSKCSAQDAITAFKKLTDVEGVKIILGTTCSGAMLGAAPLAEAEGVILLSASATSPDIAPAGDYIFRTAINDAKLGEDTGNTLWVDGIRNLATITQSTDYAEGARRTTVARFEELGGAVVASESYTSDITDFRTQLTKIFSEEPDAVYLASQSEFSGGTIIKQARELGYDGPIYTESVAVSPEALEIAGEAATGVKGIVPSNELTTETGKRFLSSYQARFGDVPSLPWFQASAYDDVYIAAECLSQTGDDQDADGFRDCLYSLTHSGAIGIDYSFDEYGDVAGLSNVVIEVLPVEERTDDNVGQRVIGPAPVP